MIRTLSSGPSEEDTRKFCQRQIVHFKIPRFIRVLMEAAMTATGKARKFRMRQAMVDELKLSENDR